MADDITPPEDPFELADRLIAELQSVVDKEQAAAEQSRHQRAEEADVAAQQRRDGERGHDWQVLQQRIDMRRTTERDVLMGLDHSAEARAVRQTLSENLKKGRTTLEEAIADPDGESGRMVAEALSTSETDLR